MKILFIIQGEGRGHLTQAISMAQILRKEGHEPVGVLVGKSAHRQLPDFFEKNINIPIQTFESPNFLPAPHGRSAGLRKSIRGNIAKLPGFVRSIIFLRNQIKQSGADLVINFYELLTGITYGIFRPETPLVCVAHQYIFLHPDYKFPKADALSLYLLKLFTRITALGADKKLALSLRPMRPFASENLTVVPPLLREELFKISPTNGEYLHGYLLNSGFRKDLEKWCRQENARQTDIFWEHGSESPHPKLNYHPLNDSRFLEYMAGCKGYITTAGFESVCEAVYLGKPVFMVPTHIEQDCNAHDAVAYGVGIASDRFDLSGFEEYIGQYKPLYEYQDWIRQGNFKIGCELERILTRIAPVTLDTLIPA